MPNVISRCFVALLVAAGIGVCSGCGVVDAIKESNKSFESDAPADGHYEVLDFDRLASGMFNEDYEEAFVEVAGHYRDGQGVGERQARDQVVFFLTGSPMPTSDQIQRGQVDFNEPARQLMVFAPRSMREQLIGMKQGDPLVVKGKFKIQRQRFYNLYFSKTVGRQPFLNAIEITPGSRGGG